MSNVEVTKADMDKLKSRADMLGVSYSPNIGFDTLKTRIEDKLAENEPKDEKTETKKKTKSAKTIARQEALKLVRVEVICKDLNKKDWQGEIISAGNSSIGMIKKYVLFNEPYHVPQIILNALKEKQVQRFYKKKIDGKEVVKAKLIPAYDISILPPLTKKEIKELAQRQAMAGTVDDE